MLNQKDKSYEGLTYGQVVKTMGRQIAIPYRYTYTDYGKNTIYPYSFNLIEKEVKGKVCIKLSQVGAEAPEWYINTGNRQSGLVCYLDPKYEGYAVLSIRIDTLATHSIYATPIEYIEVPLIMPMVDIGQEANLVFDTYKDDIKTVWHNKTE